MNNMENVKEKVEVKTKAPAKKPEAEILLDKQLEMGKTARGTDIALVAAFCAIVLALGVLFWAVPDKEYSESEKRSLKQFPEISVQRFIDDTIRDLKMMTMTEEEKKAYSAELAKEGKDLVLADEIGEYFADQFPFRDELRVLKAVCEIGMLKLENNDILFTFDGSLVKKDTVSGQTQNEDGTYRDRDHNDACATIDKNVYYISVMENFLGKTDIKFQSAVAGRSIDVRKNSLPSVFPYGDTHADGYWDAYANAVKEYNIKGTVHLRDMLSEKVDAGEYVYYKTDHHWTTLGAYYAYCSIMEGYGIEPLPLESFEREVFSDEFLGTTYASAGAALGGKDTIEFFRFEGDTDYTMTIPSGSEITVIDGFYNYKYQNVMDKYSAFLGHDNMKDNGGNNPITLLEKKTGEEREKLILIKDSFGHSLAPFLAYHFDLIILDMRYYNGDMSEYLSDGSVTHMLVLYNMETFMNDTNLSKAAGNIAAHFNKQ